MDREKQIELAKSARERHDAINKKLVQNEQFQRLVQKYASEAKPKRLKHA